VSSLSGTSLEGSVEAIPHRNFVVYGGVLQLGALYQGTPKTSITSNLGSAANLAIGKKTLDNAFNKIKWYPVIAFGLNYKF